ncbi:MAG: 23S rRNA (uracil(1939)-C(5))-methyltransferase RlmD [Flavobacteriaceae bacterium]|nr:23S rRNA (uracil(1939)-C(5))-methyltransferase RlmD [Flavobacteriaceae bacterium]MBT4416230.1 23S rRNA (uracil(1939)-C(5))-methyltransferase RlmD [Flavobacteriaceae bacterium]MBT5395176.1 23S rRNA (uracil(1939)-C(5))-methyltransferase RlmD [Flavobacteriaceae bacterium]
MSRKNKKFDSVEIIDIGSKGQSIAKSKEGIVLMVKKGVPGDVVDVETYRKKKNYYLGNITKYHSMSSLRTKAECEHFGTCGGCKWQDVIYDAQTDLKEKKIKHAIQNVFDNCKIEPIIKCENQYFYRNKLEFSFTENRWLTNEEILNSGTDLERRGVGFHISGMWDKVVDINKCHLQAEPSNKIRISIKNFAIKKDISFYNSRSKKGLLRSLMIRNTSLSQFMVIVQFYENDLKNIELTLNHLKNNFKQLSSIQYIINSKDNDSIYNQKINLYYGKKYIEEMIEELKFKIYPKSFFQTNISQTIKLYQVVKDLANLTGNEIVFDLYSGLGTITQFLAKGAKKITGIESINEAVISARESSIDNNINNVEYETGDMKKIFTSEFISTHGNPDVIITDPPREGMHKDVIKEILNLDTKIIVYVSCNPPTQCRDLELLKIKYDISKVQPVDMFPHTDHVENVVLLKLNKSI